MTFATAAQVDLCGIQKIVDAVGIHAGQTNEPVPMTRLSNLIGATQTSPLTMASAFATFANDGKYCEPIAIESVTDATGAQLPAQATSCRDAIKPEVARGVSYALQEVLNRGSGSLIQPRISTRTSFPIAAKTGTNDTNNSTWVVGYTSGLATASWFGDALSGQNRAGTQPDAERQVLQGHRRLHDRGPAVLELHDPGGAGLRHRPVPGPAVEPGDRPGARAATPSTQATPAPSRPAEPSPHPASRPPPDQAGQRQRSPTRDRALTRWQAASEASGAALP